MSFAKIGLEYGRLRSQLNMQGHGHTLKRNNCGSEIFTSLSLGTTLKGKNLLPLEAIFFL